MVPKELRAQITGHDQGKYALDFSKRILAMPEEKIRGIRSGLPTGKRHGLSNGTTIVALKFKDGVLMAADRQTSNENFIWGESTKIFEISDYSLWGAAGMVACIQELKERLKNTTASFESSVGRPIHVDGQASIMTHIFRENLEAFSYLESMFDYSCDPLLAGWDPEEKRGRIFVFESSGTTLEVDNPGYAVVGSGRDFALSVLDDRWNTQITKDTAAKLAIRSLLIAGRRDKNTSDAVLYPSTVWVVTDHGIQKMSDEGALRLAFRIARELHGRKGTAHVLSTPGKRGAR